MEKRLVFLLCATVLTFLTSSCERLNIVIGYVKNNSESELVGAEWDEPVTDSILCNDKIHLSIYLQPKLLTAISTRPGVDLHNRPDSEIQYVYIFNSDSLDKYKKLKLCDGIVKHCLVKKIEIQLNKVKEPMDTISINSSKPSD